VPNPLKSTAAAVFHHAGGLAAVRWRNRGGLRILMYHRFTDRAALARQCAHIRRHYQPVTMSAAAEWLHAGRPLPPYALAVTVDDGYADFHDLAQPVFAEYAIPATVYLATDFLDRESWLWFDRVVYAFRASPLRQALGFRLGDEESRRAAGQHVADLAVALSPVERRDLVDRLPQSLNVEIPEQAPPEYRPLSWDTVRSLASSGVEFGAHTRTHPILSAIADPEELRDEIAGSKARIEAELGRPVLHFCYPNGRMPDIGPAAVAAVRAAGMQTAVTVEPGMNQAGQDPFLLRRIAADPSQEPMYFARRAAGL